MGKYMGTSEAAQKWGISQSKITKLCREGKIKGAEQDKGGRPWRIPVDTQNPSIKHKG